MYIPAKSTAGCIEAEGESGQVRSLIAQACFSLGMLLLVAATAASLAAPFGARWGWWYFLQGFDILRWSACGGLASAVLVAAARVLGSGSKFTALICIALGLTLFGLPWSWQQRLSSLPAIHDISTDTATPPRFTLIAPLRKRAPNRIEYGGPRVASLQARAYPDIKPLILGVPPAKAFDRAFAAAQRMGWMVVDASPGSRRIEATASTFWFGFKDDVVVRITAVRGGSRVDVRSVSRVGSGDGGTNARRISTYLQKIAHQS